MLRVNQSSKCMVDDQFKIWIDIDIARYIFNLEVTEWTKIDDLPDIIQVYYIDQLLISLTINGQLLIVNRNHHKGIIITMNPSISPIKYIHDGTRLMQSSLIMIDYDHNLYRCQLSQSIIHPELIGRNVTSITTTNYPYQIWIDDDGIIRVDNEVIALPPDCKPMMIFDYLLVSEYNEVYVLLIRHNRRKKRFKFVKMFQVDYNIIDINYRGGIAIIDEDMIVRYYSYNGQLLSINDHRFKRFFNDANHNELCVELDTGEINIGGIIINKFKSLDLIEYHQPKIKSVVMNVSS